jgi:hypothetical protein
LVASRLALSRGDPALAATTAGEIVAGLHAGGVRILVAEALVAVARPLIERGLLEEAEAELGRAVEEAETLGERAALWEALALLGEVESRRDRPDAAAGLRRRALEIVREIAAGVDDPALRARFLARPEVAVLHRDP